MRRLQVGSKPVMIAGSDNDVIDVWIKALTRWLQVESKLIMIACTKKV